MLLSEREGDAVAGWIGGVRQMKVLKEPYML